MLRKGIEHQAHVLMAGENKLWQDSVPESVVKTLTAEEIQRQEIIFEFIQSERDYLRDLEVMKAVSFLSSSSFLFYFLFFLLHIF